MPIDSVAHCPLRMQIEAVIAESRYAISCAASASKGEQMSKIYFKGSLLATTVIAGMALALRLSRRAPTLCRPRRCHADQHAGQRSRRPRRRCAPRAGVQTRNPPAPAEPTSAREIVVTGTLIRNPNLVSSSPVTWSARKKSSCARPTSPKRCCATSRARSRASARHVNNGNGGASYVDLRGLGSNRNIVLLDGVRIVPVEPRSAASILNNIPLALVDRVDVLTGGASHDLRRRRRVGRGQLHHPQRLLGHGAVRLRADHRARRRQHFRADLTLGANFDDGRGNAVLSLGYQEVGSGLSGRPRLLDLRSVTRSTARSRNSARGPRATASTRPALGGLGTGLR